MRRFGRLLFEHDKWKYYEQIIQTLLDRGYYISDIQSYENIKNNYDKIAIFRHDIDNDPSAALKMSQIESRYNIRTTYYFRWKTANPNIIHQIAKNFEVGLHYESLATYIAANEIEEITNEVLNKARYLLEQELKLFQALYGLKSIASHGHAVNIKTQTTNLQLITDKLLEKFNIQEAYHVQRDEMVKISDGDSTRKFWKYNVDPISVSATNATIYFLSHPSHWDRNINKRLLTKFYHKKYQIWL